MILGNLLRFRPAPSLGLCLLLAAAGAAAGPSAARGKPDAEPSEAAATVQLSGTTLFVTPSTPYREALVRVVGPLGFEARKVFPEGAPVVLDLLEDGWRTVVAPVEAVRDRSPAAARDRRPRLTTRRVVPAHPPDGRYRYELVLVDGDGAVWTTGGGFFLRAGAPAEPGPEPRDGAGDRSSAGKARSGELAATSGSAGRAGTLTPRSATEDDAILVRDLANDGRVWLQLQADDRDGNVQEAWSLANLDGNLQVEERGNGSTLQRVALFLRQDSDGELGVGTSAPATKLHVAGTSPAIRLDDTSGPFGTWDVQSFAGDVRWVDQSSGNPVLELRYGAPRDALFVDDNGFVGFGTNLPISPLDVLSDAPVLALEERDEQKATLFLRAETVDGQRLLTMGGREDPPLLTLNQDTGAVAVHGDMQIGSSRELKERIEPLSPEVALATLADLEPVTFFYRSDPQDRHVGFIAEEVPGLVATPERKTLSPMDLVAVVTGVVQAQEARLARQQAELEALRRRLDELEGTAAGRRSASGALSLLCLPDPHDASAPSP